MPRNIQECCPSITNPYKELLRLRQAKEEKLRQVAEQEEQKKRARTEVERLRVKYCLCTDNET